MAKRHLKYLIPIIFVTCVSVACSSSPTGRSQMILKSDQELAVESARQFAEMK
jgi:hypothetical protein